MQLLKYLEQFSIALYLVQNTAHVLVRQVLIQMNRYKFSGTVFCRPLQVSCPVYFAGPVRTVVLVQAVCKKNCVPVSTAKNRPVPVHPWTADLAGPLRSSPNHYQTAQFTFLFHFIGTVFNWLWTWVKNSSETFATV